MAWGTLSRPAKLRPEQGVTPDALPLGESSDSRAGGVVNLPTGFIHVSCSAPVRSVQGDAPTFPVLARHALCRPTPWAVPIYSSAQACTISSDLLFLTHYFFSPTLIPTETVSLSPPRSDLLVSIQSTHPTDQRGGML